VASNSKSKHFNLLLETTELPQPQKHVARVA